MAWSSSAVLPGAGLAEEKKSVTHVVVANRISDLVPACVEMIAHADFPARKIGLPARISTRHRTSFDLIGAGAGRHAFENIEVHKGETGTRILTTLKKSSGPLIRPGLRTWYGDPFVPDLS